MAPPAIRTPKQGCSNEYAKALCDRQQYVLPLLVVGIEECIRLTVPVPTGFAFGYASPTLRMAATMRSSSERARLVVPSACVSPLLEQSSRARSAVRICSSAFLFASYGGGPAFMSDDSLAGM
ncbi:hypothetical protein RHS01_10186 [Rhizoctonia solani]|uniref:Uncharacterized protein n=1 Tax=Rhizoctonia solani TaxID=456999 RepID=A0A8H7I3R9_9AGAM|nr:hypothetical protein RHS01_10186 [Rhizoctonia solani]